MKDHIFEKDSKIALKENTIAIVTATSKTGHVFYARRIPYRFKVEGFDTYCQAKAGAITASGVIVPGGNGIILAGATTVHSTPEQLALALSRYMIGGVVIEKAAATGITFSAAHVVSATKFGVIAIQINASGTVSSKVPSATQAYESAAEAVSNLPAADSGNLLISYIVIEADSGDWTANTDDLTDASDLTSATITNVAALTPFASAIAFASLTPTVGAISTTRSAIVGNKNDYIVCHFTTDSSGALTNGQLTLVYRPRPLGGES